MVEEFRDRLRRELCRFQKRTIKQQRLRSETSDTVRLSLDSIRSAESEGRERGYFEGAFADDRDSESESDDSES
jgi:hypothetical protein